MLSALATLALAAPHAVLAAGTSLRAGASVDGKVVVFDEPVRVEVVAVEGGTWRVTAPVERGCVAGLDALGGVEWRVDASAALDVLTAPVTREVEGGSVTLAQGTPVRADGASLVTVGEGIEVRLGAAVVATARQYEPAAAPEAARSDVLPELPFRVGAGTLVRDAGLGVTASAPLTVVGTSRKFRRGCVSVTLTAPPPAPPADDPGVGGGIGGSRGGGAGGADHVYVRPGATLVWPDGSPAGRLREAAIWPGSPLGPWCAIALSKLGFGSVRVCTDPDDAVWLGRLRSLKAGAVKVHRAPLPALPRGVACTTTLLVAPDGAVLDRHGATCTRDGADLDYADVEDTWFEGLTDWRVALPEAADGKPAGALVRVTVKGGR